MSQTTFSNAARETKAISSLAQGILVAPPAARAQQLWLAWGIVLIPTLGFVTAVACALNDAGPSKLDLVLFASLLFSTAIGVELGFHRLFSHAAFRAKPVFRHALIVLGSMASQGPLVFWVSTHRRHHAFSDRPGDPHSPHVAGEGRLSWRGFWHAHVGWLFNNDMTDWSRYAADLGRDRKLLELNQRYFYYLTAGLILPAVIGAVVTRSAWGAFSAFLWGGLVRVFVLHHTTWAVNSVCHMFGNRPLKTRDRSGNLAWLALLSYGGSWHNTHHAFPSLAKNSLWWWQVDLCGLVLTAAEWLGLASHAHVPTERMRQLAKQRALIAEEGQPPC